MSDAFMPGRESAEEESATRDDSAALHSRIKWRVAPFLILLYLAAFLDRVNISFASLTMNRDLHISDSLFGVGAGIFFAGYLLFAVPSNIMLVRLGARRWIAVLMVLWGLVSTSMAFVHGVPVYVLLRFLLGAAEAGFFPGVILYLTLWLPASARASLMALFVLAIPLSNVLGAPLSGWILTHSRAIGLVAGSGLSGWQLLFLLEGIPPVLLGLLVPFALASGPPEVSWLSNAEKQRIASALERDRSSISTPPTALPKPWSALLTNGSMIAGAAQYFALMIGLYALSFWIPRILTSRGVALGNLGWMTAIPFAIGAAAMLLCSRHSDRTGERKWHLFGSFCSAAAGIAIAAPALHWALGLIGLSLAAAGVFSAMPIFWAAATQSLASALAPLAIAGINSVGNLGGFVGPIIIGAILQHSGSYALGLAFTSAILLCGAATVALGRGSHAVTTQGPEAKAAS